MQNSQETCASQTPRSLSLYCLRNANAFMLLLDNVRGTADKGALLSYQERNDPPTDSPEPYFPYWGGILWSSASL